MDLGFHNLSPLGPATLNEGGSRIRQMETFLFIKMIHAPCAGLVAGCNLEGLLDGHRSHMLFYTNGRVDGASKTPVRDANFAKAEPDDCFWIQPLYKCSTTL
jgi:hypothetical protein